MTRRPATTFGGGGSATYFQMLSRPQQCASVAKLSQAAMSTDAIAGLVGMLRAQVEEMIAEHDNRTDGMGEAR